MPDLSTTCADYHGDEIPLSIRTMGSDCKIDGITTSGSSDVEKRSEQDQRASLFLGKPMSLAHEAAFFAVVATSNFTPRAY
ncbi:hypothetical protein RRF57_012352 [Xylaria bambusicola]|uniref:Uncharacterized protein n=1 Tax=Xylaria bambusicola TaxID=326684 RepID=A0AAN7UPJ7_9PEZI